MDPEETYPPDPFSEGINKPGTGKVLSYAITGVAVGNLEEKVLWSRVEANPGLGFGPELDEVSGISWHLKW